MILDDVWDDLLTDDLLTTRLAPYSIISHNFKYAVEARTFKHIYVTIDELHFFQSAMRDPHRRASLRIIALDIKLQDYPRRGKTSIMPHLMPAINNKIFTKELTRFFDLLSTWNEHQNDFNCDIRLIIKTNSPAYQGNRQRRKNYIEKCVRGKYLELLAPKDAMSTGLRSANIITEFTPTQCGMSLHPWHPATYARILGSLPNVKNVYLELKTAPEIRLGNERRDHRLGN